MLKFYIEYEIPPMRAIYATHIEAEDESLARDKFKNDHPRGRIRKISLA